MHTCRIRVDGSADADAAGTQTGVGVKCQGPAILLQGRGRYLRTQLGITRHTQVSNARDLSPDDRITHEGQILSGTPDITATANADRGGGQGGVGAQCDKSGVTLLTAGLHISRAQSDIRSTH